jgi:hypothetical protein
MQVSPLCDGNDDGRNGSDIVAASLEIFSPTRREPRFPLANTQRSVS